MAPLAINALTLVTLSTYSGYCLDDNCDDFSDDAKQWSAAAGQVASRGFTKGLP